MTFFQSILRTRLFIFLFCLIVISIQFSKQGYHNPVADEFGYIAIVSDLNQTGIFTNGGLYVRNMDIKPGAFFAPAYPYFVHLVSQFSESTKETIECYATSKSNNKDGKCHPAGLKHLIWSQIVLAALSATIIFYTILMLCEKRSVAWLALVLILVDKSHVEYARHFLTENLAFFFFYLFGFLLVYAIKAKNNAAWILAGIALGLCALARPTYYYLIFFMPPVIAAFYYFSEKRIKRQTLYPAVYFCLGAFLFIFPWMTRNLIHFDQFTLTNGYASFILVQRVAYNLMNWSEWGASFIYWLPDFGDSLAPKIFGESMVEKLSWYHPESYYYYGNTELRNITLQQAGGQDQHLSFLLKEYVLGDLFKHIMVTFTIAIRGMWVGKYIGLVGFLFLIPLCFIFKNKKLLGQFFVFAFPAFFILGLNGFVSVNVPRYNEPLMVIFAMSGAYLLYMVGCKIATFMRKKTL